ncbi:hypothetical protein Tco_0133301 [Tanacetum coccineum]
MGYWPQTLFSGLRYHATAIEYGGEVYSANKDNHTSTQMGSGHFPDEGFGKAAYARNLEVVDHDNNLIAVSNLSLLAEKPNCYDVKNGYDDTWGHPHIAATVLFSLVLSSKGFKDSQQENEVFMLGSESTKMKLINARLKKINKPFVKSIKNPDGDIIDCVLFHLQPSFDNPKLKGAIMSLDPPELPKGYDNTRVESEFKQIWSSNGESCPNGTIPIRRTSASEISRSISISEFAKRTRTKDIPPSSGYTHALGYVTPGEFYGAKAILNAWAPNVTGNDYSISQILVIADAPNHGINTVFQSMYKDNLPRLFTFWTPDGYRSGCYNLECPGFVQTSSRASVGAAFSKDPKSGNWWLKVGSEDVGYWPQTLFTNLRDHATTIEYGGEVYSENSGKHMPTPMGSGHLPDEGFGKAAFTRNLEMVDQNKHLIAVEMKRQGSGRWGKEVGRRGAQSKKEGKGGRKGERPGEIEREERGQTSRRKYGTREHHPP